VKGEGEAAVHDVLPQETVLLSLGHGSLQTLDGKGILCPAINVPFVGSHGEGAKGHPLDDAVGIALQERTVHERTGVSLVSVADDVFLVSLRRSAEAPLEARGESAAPAAPEAGRLYLVDDLLRLH